MNVPWIISAVIGAGASIGLVERAVYVGDADQAYHWLDEAETALAEARSRIEAMDVRREVV